MMKDYIIMHCVEKSFFFSQVDVVFSLYYAKFFRQHKIRTHKRSNEIFVYNKEHLFWRKLFTGNPPCHMGEIIVIVESVCMYIQRTQQHILSKRTKCVDNDWGKKLGLTLFAMFSEKVHQALCMHIL